MTTDTPLDLKQTINLPAKLLPMKANLIHAEPARLERWKQMGLYHLILQSRQGRPSFILHDGPPYANGNIHIGHALNKILKDFIVKSRSMMGYWAPFVPGWDCHGLPIEIQVDKKLGAKKHDMPATVIRREARAHAERFIKAQSDDFQRLGVLGEFENPYVTMDFQYQADIVRAFGKFVEDGSVYKGARAVHWCIHCQTALAEAEIEYNERESPSIYVKFPLAVDPAVIDPALQGKTVSVLIWTTTPWTLPANLGITFHRDYEYVGVEVGNEVYIVAAGLLEAVAAAVGWSQPRVVARFKGEKLDRLKARHPFIERESLFMLGDHVTLDTGTGAVHTAPGHGYDDYMIGQRYGLDVYSPVDAQGRFTDDVEHFAGQQVFKANARINELMRERGVLLAEHTITHSYPHCWRCHHPVIFRATPQWFISMDATNLRQRALRAIETVQWYPAWGRERMYNVVAQRPDWCISRQRLWGVPIVAFYCEQCSYVLLAPEIIEHVARIFEQRGADAWYEDDAQSLLPPATRCPQCHAQQFRKETDILDVWLDSGASSLAVLERRGLPWPADVYIEGGDQFRAWFNSSLTVALPAKNAAPFRAVIAHGWTVDAAGEKMSKSKGNVVEPQDVIKKSGAEILRLWVASSDYHEEVRISAEILTRLVEAYRKIRNTACYLVNNLFDFHPAQDSVPPAEMFEIDRWILAECQQVTETVLKAYEDYEFHVVFQTLYRFCTVELSAIYFDILKDRLYTFAPKSVGRRSAQTALYELLSTLTRLMAPILAFTSDEIWEVFLGQFSDTPASVHLAEFPRPVAAYQDADLLSRWQRIMEIRSDVLKALELKRAAKEIGSGLEAKVILSASGETYDFLSHYLDQLPAVFIVSQVELRRSDQASLSIEAQRADGQKCERCWNYSTFVGQHERYPTLCHRCLPTVLELESLARRS
ncbi:MAG: isoleucine--tRNA ligase [Acidobacteriota bacterium]|nr:isoleucine--tRNA ligase [Blastocatellia bacterium]MDW8238885.1 isoleucine--tRNA ligase [Acidobacteriota bacterium]